MPTVSDLFNVRYGQSLELNRLKLSGSAQGIAFVSRKMVDNGVSAFVEPVDGEVPGEIGEITVALGGNGILSAFVQERPFYTGRDVAILTSKTDIPKSALLYYCACIRANRYRYSYGRQANRTLKTISLPELADLPEWVADPVVDFSGKDLPGTNAATPPLDTEHWKPFQLSRLFEIKRGLGIAKDERVRGTTRYVGALNRKNGLVGFIDQPPMHPGNTITLNWNGIGGVCFAFYQPEPYWCSGDVNALYPKFTLTPAIGIFIATIIQKERYRFSFGRKLTQTRMSSMELHFPSASDGEPDWEYMDRYIKSLPFSSQL